MHIYKDAVIHQKKFAIRGTVPITKGAEGSGTFAPRGWRIIQALHPQDGDCIFILTDNYLELERVRSEFPKLNIVSLCQPNETGYHLTKSCRLMGSYRIVCNHGGPY